MRSLGILALCAGAANAAPAPKCVDTPAFHACIAADGAYQAEATQLGWTFAGKLPAAPTAISTTAGADHGGAYQAVSFDLATPAVSGAIRVYADRPAAVFSLTYKSETPNIGAYASLFPALSQPASNLHHVGYDVSAFAPANFKTLGPDGPWVYFDDALHAFVLSPASHYMIAQLANRTGKLASGIVPTVAKLPAGFTQETALVAAPGVGATLSAWGRLLTDLAGKVRPANDADVPLRTLGYWTDNGATYYYKFDSTKGYPGTLLAARDAMQAAGLPAGYVQLDSWWYPKGAQGKWDSQDQPYRGGIYVYEAAPELFPNGLPAFAHGLGLPLVVHGRWIDTKSPYRQQYAMSGNVVTDPRYWDDTMSSLASAGVVTYEQDWLSGPATPDWTLTAPEEFMDHMAKAAAAHGLSLQYCMPLPRHLLQGTRYDNLFTVRTSRDRFDSTKWTEFLYTGHLAAVLGEWPWADVLMSDERSNLLIATLSAGMVGIGDAVTSIDHATLALAARPDGLIVKPDVSIAPLDQVYLADGIAADRTAGTGPAASTATPMIAAAATVQGQLRASYVFAYSRSSGTQQATIKPVDLGYGEAGQQVMVYDPATGDAALQPATTPLTLQVGAGGEYRVVTPVGPSGLALAGDSGKFVTLGRQRVTHWSDDGTLRATVAFAAAESGVRLVGYAPAEPAVTATAGSVTGLSYDVAKHLFTVTLAPDAETRTAAIELK